MSRARLQWVDRERMLREHRLDPSAGTVRVGRHPASEVCIDDPAVSRHHLLLTPVGDTWFVEDVSGAGAEFERQQRAPLLGRRPLATGDRVHIGPLILLYRNENERSLPPTVTNRSDPVALSPNEHRVLERLCAPVVLRSGPPASNREIAADLFLSVEGVRSHLKSMYRKLGIDTGTTAQRRAELVRRAIDERYVSPG